MFEDDAVAPRTHILVGEDLSLLSIGDLEERVDALRAEIERIENELRSKRDASAAAEAVFGKH